MPPPLKLNPSSLPSRRFGAAAGLASPSPGAGSAAPPLVGVNILGNLTEVGPEGVVAAPCLRIGQDVVGFRDLLERVPAAGSELTSGW